MESKWLTYRLTNVLKNEEYRIRQLLLCFLFYVYIYINYCCGFPINLLLQFDIIAVFFRFHIITIDLLLPIRFDSTSPLLPIAASFALCTHTSIDNGCRSAVLCCCSLAPPATTYTGLLQIFAHWLFCWA